MIDSALNLDVLGAPREVTSAIQKASAKTGVDFSYLLNQAKVESSFQTDAKAKTSSATGLYQFIDQTWLGMVKTHGAEHGKPEWANAIETRNGRHFVSNPALKSDIMNARKDAEFSALMAGEFASDNKSILENKLDKEINATDLYMAHFLGAGGATTFLSAMENNPNQRADTVISSAAHANKNVFYNKDGSAKTVSEIYQNFASKIDDDGLPNSVLVQQDNSSSNIQNASYLDSYYAKNDSADVARIMGTNKVASERSASQLSFNPVPIQTPIQARIGNDLLSGPLLALFTDNNHRSENFYKFNN